MNYDQLAIIPGDCLYPDHSNLKDKRKTLFFMAEDKDLCTHFRYHKHKLVLFLSAMRSHADELKKQHPLEYFHLDDHINTGNYTDKLRKTVEKHKIKRLVSYNIEDKFFRNKILNFCLENDIDFIQKESPGFLNTPQDFREYLDEVSKPRMQNYYIRQRKKFDLLIRHDKKPLHGKWSFDSENRKKLPADIKIPERSSHPITKHTKEVKKLVDRLFPDHPGNTRDFFYATTREDARKELEKFLSERFSGFGPYQDAIDKGNTFLFHSVLSPYLNSGLLTPHDVVNTTIEYADNNKVNYPGLEGFIRQIIGWREFIRGMYNHYDLKDNFFGHNHKLSGAWWEGKTGIDPLDDTINKVSEHAYVNHIERLMIAGNIMLLSEIHPDEVFRWFMEMFIDSADWVMEPNVYGMSQFADGGIFATKPYIAGSNYILKMSNYSRGPWCDTLDGLYWRFIDKKRDFLRKNARMGVMIKNLDRMEESRKKMILKKADKFISEKT